MALTGQNHRTMLRGLEEAGFVRIQDASPAQNPIRLRWQIRGRDLTFRLWVFDITPGGGGSTVRPADEFRIQVTNGPARQVDFDADGYVDLLFGYSPSSDAIVAYDRRWLEKWTKKYEETGSGGSPSTQVKKELIDLGITDGIHHFQKSVSFGQANLVTLRPDMLPGYLMNHEQVLGGRMNAAQVEALLTSTASDNVVDYCAQRGFSFEPELIARYIASFLAKPFVILAGVSGTGKSKLAELVAEYYSRANAPVQPQSQPGAPAAHTGSEYVFVESVGSPDPSRFALVAVRPDWIDNQSVLGFVNPITQAYESTQTLDLILRAQKALSTSEHVTDAPRYFMLLDEMNLAKVEHYFSDWLACSESRRYMPDGTTIAQQAIPLHRSAETLTATLAEGPSGTVTTIEVPEDLVLPTNLIVTGTVNVDETTYGLSPKVLDRAMVLEFDEVDLDRLRGEAAVIASAVFRFPDELPGFRLPTNLDYHEIPAGTHIHLKAINSVLENARLHFGYRSASEMARFMVIYNGFLPELAFPEEDDDWLRALDVAILQKVLPRLQGNRAKLEQTLVRMCLYLRDLADNSEAAVTTAFDRASPAKLPKSYRRALEMLDALRDFGFVSFFK